APRLRRLKFDEETQAKAAEQALLLGTETPIWGSVVAHFRDVDGNSFTLASYDEVTHTMEAQRRSVALRQEMERRAARGLGSARDGQAGRVPEKLRSDWDN